ncbi:Tc toxin subunit A-related protein [Haladaptatus sp. NG-WS-4]
MGESKIEATGKRIRIEGLEEEADSREIREFLNNQLGIDWRSARRAIDHRDIIERELSVEDAEEMRRNLEDLGVKVELLDINQFGVSGTIKRGSTPLAGVSVIAYDRDLRGRTALGRTSTDEDGNYEITYVDSDSDGRPNQEFGIEDEADIQISVHDVIGNQIAESEIAFNVGVTTRIDVRIGEGTRITPSEYRVLESNLDASLNGEAVSALSDEEIAFLQKDLQSLEGDVNLYVEATRFAEEIGLNQKIGYVLGRGDLELNGDSLLETDSEQIREILMDVIRDSDTGVDDRAVIFLDELEGSIDDIVTEVEYARKRLRRGQLEQRDVLIELIDTETGDPVRDFTLELIDTSTDDVSYEISDNNDGTFVLTYFQPKDGDDEVLHPIIRILDFNGSETQIKRLTLDSETEKPLKVDAPIRRPGDVSLETTFGQPDELNPENEHSPRVRLSKDAINFLSSDEIEIETLADIRERGTIRDIDGITTVLDATSIDRLEAHAALSVLPTEIETNERLIDSKYRDIFAIAETDEEEFVRTLTSGEVIDKSRARKIHWAALAERKYLKQTLAHLRTLRKYDPFLEKKDLPPGANMLNKLALPLECECEECDLAVSPRAYLTYLLDYALDTVTADRDKLSLDEISNLFHQEFKRLLMRCETAEERIRHIRLAVEVLLEYIHAHESLNLQFMLGDPDIAEYRMAVYDTLLNQFGTSREEIQEVTQNGDDDERERLANRIGVDRTNLPGLLFDPTVSPQTDAGLSELDLEKTFGYQATTIADADGEVKLRDPLLGLSDIIEEEDDIERPYIHTWQQEYLRQIWLRVDHPVDPYTPVITGLHETNNPARTRYPIIDPDVIGPDDFRTPDPNATTEADEMAHRAFKLWINRREWVDRQLSDLRTKGFDLALIEMTEQFEYNGEHPTGPWATLLEFEEGETEPRLTDLITELSALHEQLLTGEYDDATQEETELADQARERIENELHLTAESFLRLVNLHEKHHKHTTSQQGDQLTEEELEEAISILVQAQKRILYLPIWVKEEEELGVQLGPEAFWLSLTPPTDGKWSSKIDEQFEDKPFIDPEETSKEDLPDWASAGTDARTLYQERVETLRAQRETIEEAYWSSTTGFNDALAATYSDALRAEVTGSRPWLEYFSTRAQDLSNSADTTEIETEAEQLRLTIEEFETLAEIGAKLDHLLELDATIPTEEDILEALDFLTTAWEEVTPGAESNIESEEKRLQIEEVYRENGLDDALDEIYPSDLREEIAGTKTWTEYLTRWAEDLEDTGDELQTEIIAEATKLHLSTDDEGDELIARFEALTAIATRPEKLAERESYLPSEDELTETFDFLTSTWKAGVVDDWISEEESEATDPNTGEVRKSVRPYWRARKAKIQPWLGSQAKHRQWQLALRRRNRPPDLDPDIVLPSSTTHRGAPRINESESENPLSERRKNTGGLWNKRKEQVEKLRTELETHIPDSETAIPAEDIDTLLTNAIGVTLDDLRALIELEREGFEVGPRLEQLLLSRSAYLRIVDVLDLVEEHGEIDRAVGDDLLAILVQVRKTLLFPEWRREERKSRIIVSPDIFELPDEDDVETVRSLLSEDDPTITWRRDSDVYRDWVELLESRIEQRDSVGVAIAEAVDSAEETALPLLRDALIEVAGDRRVGAEYRAERLTDRLLVDMETDSCQKTTRIGQAINVVQGFVFGVRSGTGVKVPNTEFKLSDKSFDRRWRWIGSYATWKAAMAVFLYPENILLPSLRRAEKRTPQFENMTDALDEGATTTQVEKQAKAYHEYLSDIYSLDVKASCWAESAVTTASGQQKTVNTHFVFAEVGSDLYFAKNWEINKGYHVTHWMPLPPMPRDTKHVDIIGADYCEKNPRERYIWLFLRRQKYASSESEIVYVEYDIEADRWLDDDELAPQPIELPHGYSDNLVVGKSGPHPILAVAYEREVSQGKDLHYKHPAYPLYPVEFEVTDNPSSVIIEDYHRKVCTYIYIVSYDPKEDEWVSAALAQKKDWEFDLRLLNTEASGGGISWENLPVSGKSVRDPYQNYKDKSRSETTIDIFSETPFGVLSPELEAYYNWFQLPFSLQEISLEELTAVDPRDESTQWILVGVQPRDELADHIDERLVFALIDTRDEITDDSLESREYHSVVSVKGEAAYGFSWQGVLHGTKASAQNALFGYFYDVDPKVRKIAVDSGNLSVSTADTEGSFFPSSWTSAQIIPSSVSSENTRLVSYKYFVGDRYHYKTAYANTTSKLIRATSILPKLPLSSAGEVVIPKIGPPIKNPKQYASSVKTLYKETSGPEIFQTYLNEAYYFLPLYAGLQLKKSGQYQEALDWLQTVYDYASKKPIEICPFLQQDSGTDKENTIQTPTYWLDDPLDVHGLARERPGSYIRYTVFEVVRCLLDFADSEFTKDNVESVSKARQLYETALDILERENLVEPIGPCSELKITVEQRRRTVIALMEGDGRNISNISVKLGGESRDFRLDGLSYVEAASRIDELGKELERITVARSRERASSSVQGHDSSSTEEDEQILDRETAILATAQKLPNPTHNDPSPRLTETHLNDALTLAKSARTTATDPFDFEAERADRTRRLSELYSPLLTIPSIARGANRVSAGYVWSPPTNDRASGSGASFAPIDIDVTIDGPPMDLTTYVERFCIPNNPIPMALQFRAEVNLLKIRTCRNIAGMERQLEPYAAPTDLESALPSISPSGQLTLPGTVDIQPTQYRYRTLIDRTKELLNLARQIEADLLRALERADDEAYRLLEAQHGLESSKAGVKLQNLRVNEAEDGIDLAELQKEGSELRAETYQALIDEGLNEHEKYMIPAYYGVAAARTTAAALRAHIEVLNAGINVGATNWLEKGVAASQFAVLAALAPVEAVAVATAAGLEAEIGVRGVLAAKARREQEWRTQKTFAEHDAKIGDQQITLAEDRLKITEQERNIAELQREHAEEIINFLEDKETGEELYRWMVGILEDVYRYFLQQANAVARLAENQLAFERQEPPAGFIQTDYWEPPSEDMSAGVGGVAGEEEYDRRGLTGSARLLQDVYKLDQYAFKTAERKLNAQKTISLAQLFPVEFQQFRETGVLTFPTPMELFDRDHPGHYLRLIKRVGASVVALTPPEGINASLTASGISRVVTGGDIFQRRQITRLPETIALSAPFADSGIYELQPESEGMLMPFENMGVDTTWEFRMPKAANQFDYNTITDVLVTINYTALNSYDYRQKVVQELDPKIEADRAYSFRTEFADQWYDLNNPEQSAEPMTVRFTTSREEFPPNLDDVDVEHVLMYFIGPDDESLATTEVTLTFDDGSGFGPLGGTASIVENKVSTRKPSALNLSAITSTANGVDGEWTLTLPNTSIVRDLFEQDIIEDILFVLTYSGRTSEWPE